MLDLHKGSAFSFSPNFIQNAVVTHSIPLPWQLIADVRDSPSLSDKNDLSNFKTSVCR